MISRQDHVAQDQVDGLSSSLESIPTVTVATTAPTSPSVGDIWMNSSNGYQMQQWDGAAWNVIQLGTSAIASGSVTTALLAAGAVTAANIQAGTVVAGMVDGTTIEGAQFIAHGSSGEVLVYNGTPALNNLLFALSGSSGSDSNGNSYGAGLTLLRNTGSITPLTFADPIGSVPLSKSAYIRPDVTPAPALVVVGPGNGPEHSSVPSPFIWLAGDPTLSGTANEIHIDADSISLEQTPDGGLTVWNPLFASSSGVNFGAGPAGKYYYEEVTLSGSQSIPSGTVTQVKPYTAGTLYSDYGSAWNLSTGVWTCPVTGPYDWDVVMGLVGSLSSARCFVRVCKTFNTGPFYCVDDVPISAGNLLSATGTFSASAGDTYHVEVYQSTGAAHTLDNTVSYVHIGRRL